MSGRTLEIFMSLWAVWGLAHGFKALKHWKVRKPMTLAFWQGGLVGQGKVVRGAALWVLGWSSVALVVSVGLWIGGAVPFNVGKTVSIALCVPGIVITFAASRPTAHDPAPPEVPLATAATRQADEPGGRQQGDSE